MKLIQCSRNNKKDALNYLKGCRCPKKPCCCNKKYEELLDQTKSTNKEQPIQSEETSENLDFSCYLENSEKLYCKHCIDREKHPDRVDKPDFCNGVIKERYTDRGLDRMKKNHLQTTEHKAALSEITRNEANKTPEPYT